MSFIRSVLYRRFHCTTKVDVDSGLCGLQAKPFAVLPGNGMAIEVTLKSSDKVTSHNCFGVSELFTINFAHV